MSGDKNRSDTRFQSCECELIGPMRVDDIRIDVPQNALKALTFLSKEIQGAVSSSCPRRDDIQIQVGAEVGQNFVRVASGSNHGNSVTKSHVLDSECRN